MRSPPTAPPTVVPSASADRFGRYRVLGEIGRGGMSQVFLGHDPELDREVAIKVLLGDESATPAELERLVQEARTTSQLEHPNIVPVYDVATSADARLYFVMRRVQGRTLRDVLRDWAPDARRRLIGMLVQVCRAVAFAHERGVLHRDLKPENILLGAFGEVYVADWGIARSVEAGPFATRSIGTTGYVGPEQARGEPSAASDTWSLGAIFYELVVGRPAYSAERAGTMQATGEYGAPEWPIGVDEELSDIGARVLDPRHPSRIRAASELADRLTAFLDGDRRRELAAERLAAAESTWSEMDRAAIDLRALRARLTELEAAIEPWAPLDDKREIFDLTERLAAHDRAQADRFAQAIAQAERALSQDPESGPARAFLARAYYSRFEEAERSRHASDMALYSARVRAYDAGSYVRALDAGGRLILDTSPSRARVICREFLPTVPKFTLTEPVDLGTTPIDLELKAGSYLLELDGVRYPVRIERGRVWEGGTVDLPAEQHEDWVYVPEGPFQTGGDPNLATQLPAETVRIGAFWIQRNPVTMGEYEVFIRAIAQRSKEEALARVPRRMLAAGRFAPIWAVPTDGTDWRVPVVDEDGDAWDSRFPAFGVSWEDAVSYARWLSESANQSYSLPSELQWEKAARGVDGRFYPWGNTFDGTLCRMAKSRPGRPLPESVDGWPEDVSIYGVRHLAGLVREWTADSSFDHDRRRRAVRGGAWTTTARLCRSANRFGFEPWVADVGIGFRLIAS